LAHAQLTKQKLLKTESKILRIASLDSDDSDSSISAVGAVVTIDTFFLLPPTFTGGGAVRKISFSVEELLGRSNDQLINK
jgi:hypothetical protein